MEGKMPSRNSCANLSRSHGNSGTDYCLRHLTTLLYQDAAPPQRVRERPARDIFATMMYLCSQRTYISGVRLSVLQDIRGMADDMAKATDQMDPRELQTLQYYLKEYGQQAEIFAGQLELMENGRIEALAAIEALEVLGASDDGTVLLQVGGGASLRAKVLEPEKVLVNIGSDVIVEKPNKDAIGYLRDRVTEMEASQKQVAEALDRLRGQMNEITRRLEQGYQQAMSAGPAAPPQVPEEEQD